MTFFFPLSFVLGYKFSRSKTQKIISLVSIISTFGIALGVMVLIIGLSAMNGFERELNNRVLSIIPHGNIRLSNVMMQDWKKILLYVKNISNVSHASPYVETNAFIEKEKKIKIIQVQGIDINLEKNVNNIHKFLSKSTLINFSEKKKQIIIGYGLAKFFKIKKGDWIKLTLGVKNFDQNFLQLKVFDLQVIDIFKINEILDQSFTLIPLKDMQKYLNIGDHIHGISIKFYNPFDIHQADFYNNKTKNLNINFTSWTDTYGYMYHDINMIRTIIYLSMFLVIIIACFNVISILLMIIKEKINDIAILKTIGAKNTLIYGVFIWYSILIGFSGIMFGTILSILILFNFEFLIKSIEHILGRSILAENIYFIDFLPVELRFFDVIHILIIVFFLTLLSSLYPAYRIINIQPSKILNKKL